MFKKIQKVSSKGDIVFIGQYGYKKIQNYLLLLDL